MLYRILAAQIGIALLTVSGLAWAEEAAREQVHEALIAELQSERQELREELQLLRGRYDPNDDAFVAAVDEWNERRVARLIEWQERWNVTFGETANEEVRISRTLPEEADEATILHFRLRQEMVAVREASMHLSEEERRQALLQWREANEHRFEEALALADRQAAEAVPPGVVQRDYTGLPSAERDYLEARDVLRTQRYAIAARFGPGEEAERREALIEWREQAQEDFEALARLLEAIDESEEGS